MIVMLGMKHLYVINNSNAQYGVNTYIRQLLEVFKGGVGCLITLVNWGSTVSEVTVGYKNGIRFINIPYVHPKVYVKEEKIYQSVGYIILSYLNYDEYNVFHYNYFSDYNLAVFIKSGVSNSRHILTVHYLRWGTLLNGNVEYYRSILSKKVRSKFEQDIYEEYIKERVFCDIVDCIICLSEFTSRLLKEDYEISPKKVVLIYNAIKMIDDDKPCEFLFKSKNKIILYVGRIEENKGITFLIAAFKRVLKSVPDSYLVIIGDGNYDIVYREIINIWDHVILTGKLSQKLLCRFYEIADVGVLPSLNEQCSYAIIEMLLHGLNVITTNALGLSEMVEKENRVDIHYYKQGIAFPIDVLAEKILNNILFSHKEKIKENVIYSFDSFRAKMIDLYLNI